MSASEPSSPAARACTRTLPSAVASTGPASTWRPVTSAVSWHSSALRAPPPMTWMRRRRGPRRPRGARARGGTCRRARRDRAHDLPAGPGRLAGRAGRGDPRGHVAAAQEALVVGVEERHVGAAPARAAVQRRAQVRRSQRAAALLHEPQTHDVLSRRMVPSTPRSLVSCGGRCASKTGSVQLEAEQRPGPRGQDRRRGALIGAAT